MDARTRQLERAASEGDEDAQAALLVHRCRAGTLTRNRLELAAYLGDAIAARACANLDLSVSKYTGRWLRRIIKIAPSAGDRIVVICAEMIANGHRNIPPPVGSRRYNAVYQERANRNSTYPQCVAYARMFITDRTEDHRETLRAALNRLEDHQRAADYMHRYHLPSAAHLDDLVDGKVTEKTLTRVYKQACQYRSPPFSKYGEQQVANILRLRIEADLIKWALSTRP
jgi:hypothetical protein